MVRGLIQHRGRFSLTREFDMIFPALRYFFSASNSFFQLFVQKVPLNNRKQQMATLGFHLN